MDNGHVAMAINMNIGAVDAAPAKDVSLTSWCRNRLLLVIKEYLCIYNYNYNDNSRINQYR